MICSSCFLKDTQSLTHKLIVKSGKSLIGDRSLPLHRRLAIDIHLHNNIIQISFFSGCEYKGECIPLNKVIKEGCSWKKCVIAEQGPTFIDTKLVTEHGKILQCNTLYTQHTIDVLWNMSWIMSFNIFFLIINHMRHFLDLYGLDTRLLS